MLLTHLLPVLGLFVAHYSQPAIGDTFSRIVCWCRNETEIGWFRSYKYHNDALDQDFAIHEKCLDYFSDGECRHWEDKQKMVCQDYPSVFAFPTANSKMNTFCYNQRGVEYVIKKNRDDVILFNKHKRNLETRLITENATKEAFENACGQICYAEFRLPIMLPWYGGHGIIESHAEQWAGDFWYLDVCDGCTGYDDGITGLGNGIANDKGGTDHDLTGHYGPKGYYDTSGYDGKALLDAMPVKD